ncbi:hypothetical protein H7849_18120 [Alloacidobacterium dinghuense]|uniref:Uncharacterized protein n=1 Tax=Alloacidobacterium dinghuense TaxID=2763107 RepID=A0A7G8BEP0_9BACT|nr:hypothetical protein [Alloacidobacterium dinghuense]QNI31010.1 hypothetical protein H7849_18120 [Alloacidobacterium dinghuense]
MALAPISSMLTYADPCLWAAAFLAFMRVRKHAALSAFGAFLGIRMASTLIMLGLSRAHISDSPLLHSTYFYTHWITYLAGCVALFFALQEIFINMMAPLPGLRHLGLAGFRWAAVVSLVLSLSSVVTLASASSIHDHLAAIFTEIAVCFSVLALCLLAFLVVSIHALGLSYRNRVFGICVGLILLSATDLMVNAFHFSSIGNWAVQISGIVTVVALLTWVAFLGFHEHLEQPTATSVSSSALLWNDLAHELGPNAPKPAPQSGFLQNVESVVDRVLAKNSLTG